MKRTEKRVALVCVDRDRRGILRVQYDRIALRKVKNMTFKYVSTLVNPLRVAGIEKGMNSSGERRRNPCKLTEGVQLQKNCRQTGPTEALWLTIPCRSTKTNNRRGEIPWSPGNGEAAGRPPGTAGRGFLGRTWNNEASSADSKNCGARSLPGSSSNSGHQ